MTLFAAEGVEGGDATRADVEQVELARCPVADLPARLVEIEDAETLVGLLLLLRDRGK